jgi:hypothetical protein
MGTPNKLYKKPSTAKNASLVSAGIQNVKPIVSLKLEGTNT